MSGQCVTVSVLTEATRQISEVASHINDHIKQQDNFMKMLAIQKSLSGPAVPKLLIPGRNFIKEGTLKKVGGLVHLQCVAIFSHENIFSHPCKLAVLVAFWGLFAEWLVSSMQF